MRDVFASAEKGVARVRYTGTNRGAFMGTAATGKSVTGTCMVPGSDSSNGGAEPIPDSR